MGETNAAASTKPGSLFSSLIVGFVVAGLFVTIVSCLANLHWVADLFAQFKLHWAMGMLGLLFMLACFRRWRWFIACLVGLIVNLIPVWPYLLPLESKLDAKPAAVTEAGFRLLSFNLLTKNRRYEEVVEFLEKEQADFVILLEVNAAWKSVLSELNGSYKFTQFETREDNFGIAFLSKHAWSNMEVFYSQSLQLPSIDAQFEQLNGVALSKPLRIIGTHPIPPMSHLQFSARNEQLVNVANRFDDKAQNVMAGDFNLTPWSPVFSEVLTAGKLQDSARRFGVEPTWYVFPSWIGGLKIDHVLTGAGVEAVRHRIGPEVGSDHRAVVVDLELKP